MTKEKKQCLKKMVNAWDIVGAGTGAIAGI